MFLDGYRKRTVRQTANIASTLAGEFAFSISLSFTLLAIGLIWFNNNVLPDFNYRARLLALDIARKKPMITSTEAPLICSEFAELTASW